MKIAPGEEYEPIIEFREEDASIFSQPDEYYLCKLKEIGENEKCVVYSRSSVLSHYFGDNVFHDIIYGEIKSMLEEVLGKL